MCAHPPLGVLRSASLTRYFSDAVIALVKSEMLLSTASAVFTPAKVTVLCPAADGRPNSRLTIQLNEPNGPQPLAPGTPSALSTRLAPVKPRIASPNPLGSLAKLMAPGSPVIGLL